MVEVLESPRASPALTRLSTSTAIVVDVLRASTTIVTALKWGARAVIPVPTPEIAIQLRRATDESLACGERLGIKFTDGDLGNSPLEYTPDRVRGKTIFLTTTNGTPLCERFATARTTLLGTLRNAQSVAATAIELDAPILIGCAGTNGELALEDLLGAGAIVDSLLFRTANSIRLGNDSARAALTMYRSARNHILQTLQLTSHGTTLIRLGCQDDIAFASIVDADDGVVPTLKNGCVTNVTALRSELP